MADGYVVYGLREIYYELGKYEFKIVLDPKRFTDGHESMISFIDSDGNTMKHSVRKWGRKLNCTFIVDEDTPDGVSSIDMNLKPDIGQEMKKRLSIWIIKP